MSMFGNMVIDYSIYTSDQFVPFLDPRIPAFEGAPLYRDDTKQATESPGSGASNDTNSSPDTKTETGATAEDSREKIVTSREPQSDQSPEESVTTAPPTVTIKPFPVVVFSHGLSAMRTICCGICSDLASHGYVVAAVEHRYVGVSCKSTY